jgi:hypothetical protein
MPLDNLRLLLRDGYPLWTGFTLNFSGLGFRLAGPSTPGAGSFLFFFSLFFRLIHFFWIAAAPVVPHDRERKKSLTFLKKRLVVG